MTIIIDMKRFIVILIFCSSLILLSSATIDYSNLDLLNFRYFKNFPMIDYAKSNILTPINQHFDKKKAVIKYFRNLLFGNPLHDQNLHIEFDPHFGEQWNPHYEHNYGYHGHRLVDLLGRGYSPEEIQHHGGFIPADFVDNH